MVRIITRLGEIKKDDAKLEEHALGDFKVGTIIGKLRAIIAAEDVEVKDNEVKPIKIRQIKIPANNITFLAAYASNRYGHAVAVGEEIPLPMGLEKTVDYAFFLAGIECSIKKDDLLGVLILLPVKVIR